MRRHSCACRIHLMQMDTSIFKAYDIRGVYPTQLDENAAYRIGWGFSRCGILSADKMLVVGRDMRESSDTLFEAFAAGARDNGHDVIDIGLSTTPMLYFAVNELAAAGGAMITASHNPGEYNGFKLVQRGAIPIGSDSGLKEIKQQALRAPARRKDGPVPIIHRRDIGGSYARFFSQRFSIELSKPLIIDTGNGITGPVLRRVLRDQAIDYRELFFEPDGRFPNHEANPLKEGTLSQLKETIAETPHSIGAAFDGDGDRVCFVDEDGHVVRGDLLCALLARRLLEEDGPADILYDLRSSRIVPEVIHAFGGEPVKTRVGHAFVKQIMRERQALFGGELSYHFYFRDFFHCESGILAMLHVCRLLAETGQDLSELVAPFRKYSHSGEVNFRVSDTASVLRMLEDDFADGRVSYLDGLSIEYDEWWFNVRPSNTEPLLRLNLEANTPHLMQEKLDLITQMIECKQEGDR
jgi:phosphomannomutase